MRARAGRPDLLLALATLALATTGVLLILSASSILAFNRHGDQLYFVKRQVLFGGLGVLALVWAQGLDPQRLRRWLPWALLGVLTLLAAVLVPGLGRRVGGARRWLALGPFGFQPSELFKLVAVLFAADRLARALDAGLPWKAALPSLAPLGLGLALVLVEPDFGATLVTVAMLLGLLFVAGLPWRVLGLGALAAAPLLAWLVVGSPYRLRRLEVFLDPWKDPHGAGFQITHSMMAFGTGGLFGAGLGEGKQKLYYLPEPHNDFIFATAGEELGLLGCLAILGFFVLLLWRAWVVVLKSRDTFLKLASLGLTLYLGLQVLLNLYVVLGLAPTKGAALPFLSSGGSALLFNLVAVGLLMGMGKHADGPAAR